MGERLRKTSEFHDLSGCTPSNGQPCSLSDVRGILPVMDEVGIIRGRKVVFEREPPRGPVEHLRYSLDVFDAGDNLIAVLGRVADLAAAHAGFEAVVGKYPALRICIRERCRVIRSNDQDR